MGALRLPQRTARRGRERLGGAEARVGPRLGEQPGALGTEVVGNGADVLILKGRRHLLHDRVLAAAVLVLLDGPYQVVLVLAGKGRVDGRDGDAVLAVTRDAQRTGLRQGALGGLAAAGEGLAGKVR